MRTRSRPAAMVVAVLVLVFLICALWACVQYLVFPMLPSEFQINLVWLAAVFVAALTILASLAQITGYSLKEIFMQSVRESSARPELATVGTKDIVAEAESDKSLHIQRLMQEIQHDLHSTNDQLPGVLVSCLELCHLASLPEDYGRWVNLELAGYPAVIPDNLAEWIDKWGSHRLVPGYIELWNRDPSTRRKSTLQLSTRALFFSQPLPEVLRISRKAIADGNNRFETRLVGYGSEFVAEVEQSIREAGYDPRIMPDAPLYFGSASVLRILDGVRSRVVWLLDDVRRRETDQPI
jgi:hypothetical protein